MDVVSFLNSMIQVCGPVSPDGWIKNGSVKPPEEAIVIFRWFAANGVGPFYDSCTWYGSWTTRDFGIPDSQVTHWALIVAPEAE